MNGISLLQSVLLARVPELRACTAWLAVLREHTAFVTGPLEQIEVLAAKISPGHSL